MHLLILLGRLTFDSVKAIWPFVAAQDHKFRVFVNRLRVLYRMETLDMLYRRQFISKPFSDQ